MSESRYTPLTPAPEDTSRPSSPHEQLFPSFNTSYNVYKYPTTYAVTFNPAVALRILSTVLALITFIILVVDGESEFIAADIFLMSIIIVNILLIIHHFVSHVFKVTVEVRKQVWEADLVSKSKSKPKVAMYFDIGLAIIVLLCLIIGSSVKRWGGAWKAAVVIGYIVVLIQILIAVPTLDSKTLTLTAKLSDSKGKPPKDTKAVIVVDDTERGSARRRATESEEPRQSAEDLV